jgi:hypothetical protein
MAAWDIDVDRETLFLFHEFEPRVRHRQVRISLADSAECLVGEMNVLVALGAADDPPCHIGEVRINFHDVQDWSCAGPVATGWAAGQCLYETRRCQSLNARCCNERS